MKTTLYVDIVSCVQAGIVGIFVILFKNGLLKARKYLGLFLLTFFGCTLKTILIRTYGVIPYEFLPFNFWFLSMPLLYAFVTSMSTEKIDNKWFLFGPGIIESLLFIAILLLPISEQRNFQSYYFKLYSFYLLVSFTYSLYYCRKIISKVDRFNLNLSHNLSDFKSKRMIWVKYVSYLYLTIEILYMVYYFVPFDENWIWSVIFGLLNAIVIYSTSITSLIQINLDIDLRNESIYNEEECIINQKTDLKNELLTTFNTIDEEVKKTKPYLQSDLTLSSLSKQLKIDPKEVSKAINEISGKSFYGYINTYRIEESQKLLSDNKYEHYSILGIGFESGFNSKASFYKNFKEITGMTPTAYNEKRMEETVL